MNRLDELQQQLRILQTLIEEELEKQYRFGQDSDYPKGTVLSWVRTFSHGGKKYIYAALKSSDNQWYLTGRQSAPCTFDQLVDTHLRYAFLDGADHIWQATKWEAVVEV